MAAIWHSAREGFFMFWETLWALVLGFGLSGAVQAFVSREEMQRLLGDHRPVTVARASGFGMISSSCSYAAAAIVGGPIMIVLLAIAGGFLLGRELVEKARERVRARAIVTGHEHHMV